VVPLLKHVTIYSLVAVNRNATKTSSWALMMRVRVSC